MQPDDPGIVAQIESVGSVLSRYIEVHDEIFAPGIVRTIRRALPIPGLFERVPFEEHASRLQDLRLTLERVSATLQASHAPSALHAPLSSYSAALRETIHQLEQICLRLHEKSQDPEAYESSSYQRDCAAYDRSVLEYRRAGEALNHALRAPLS